MPLFVPIENDTNQEFLVTLLDEEFLLRILYNERAKSWFMDIFDADGELIAANLGLLLGKLIGPGIVDRRFPKGVFVLSDLENTSKDATIDDLGTRVCLYFYTASELVDL